MQKHQLYIDGQFVDPAAGKWFESFNPYTGEAWTLIAQSDATDADRAVQAAHRAFTQGPWSTYTPTQRGLLLHKLGDLVARDSKKLADIEVRDNG